MHSCHSELSLQLRRGDRLPGGFARFARTDLKSGRASERGRATSRNPRPESDDRDRIDRYTP
eukprot:4521608-Pyramimonas_sp.AAC.1